MAEASACDELYALGRDEEARGDVAAAADLYARAARGSGTTVALRLARKRLPETVRLVPGSLDAALALARLHHVGRRGERDDGGLRRSQKAAVRWLELAAARGSTDAMDALGYCYFEGHGVPEDAPRAEALWAESLEKQRAAKVEAAEKARAEAEAAEARAREADAEAGAKDDEAEGVKDEEDDAGAKEEEAGDEVEDAKGEEDADEAEVEEADAENEEAADEPEEDEENDDPAPPPPEESDDPAPPPPKRKRGRPPKVRAPEPAPDAPPAKRKRGRPPKAR